MVKITIEDTKTGAIMKHEGETVFGGVILDSDSGKSKTAAFMVGSGDIRTPGAMAKVMFDLLVTSWKDAELGAACLGLFGAEFEPLADQYIKEHEAEAETFIENLKGSLDLVTDGEAIEPTREEMDELTDIQNQMSLKVSEALTPLNETMAPFFIQTLMEYTVQIGKMFPGAFEKAEKMDGKTVKSVVVRRCQEEEDED